MLVFTFPQVVRVVRVKANEVHGKIKIYNKGIKGFTPQSSREKTIISGNKKY